MLLCAEYVLPITQPPIEKGAVLVRDGKIQDVGRADVLKARYAGEETKDFGLAALMPGLVNLNSRLEHAVMRGIVHDEPYITWLQLVNETSSLMNGSDWHDSAILGGLEALSAGITTVADVTSSSAPCDAVRELGLRSVIYREVTAMDKRRVDHAMRQAKSDVEKWQDEYASDLVTVGIAAGPLYACHPLIFSKIVEFADDTLPVALQLAASREEYNFIKRGSSALSVHSENVNRGSVEIPPWLPTGVTPVNYVLNWGGLDAKNILAVHCVHVNDDDLDELRSHDVAIAVCQRCNAQLGMGVPPLADYLRAGMRVGLGTDSPAATDSTDLFIEMRTGMLLQRAVTRNMFLDSATMLEMATMGGARALRMEDKIGSLEVGKLADIVAVDLSGSHQTPTTDPISAVVNTAASTDVVMTMVNGQVLYESDQWHVDVQVARNIASVIEIRGKLRG